MKSAPVYIVQGNYSKAYGWEDLGEYDDLYEANKDLHEYRMATPDHPHRVVIRKENA